MKTILCLLFCVLAFHALEAREVGPIQAETVAKSGNSWNGSSLPAYPQGEPEITILKISIPAKSVLPWHKHPFINAGVLLSGELQVVSEAGETLNLVAGDSIIELVNTWHRGENKGEVPAVIMVFYAGIKDAPVTVKK